MSTNGELLSLRRGEIHAAELLVEPAPPEQLQLFESDARFDVEVTIRAPDRNPEKHALVTGKQIGF